MTTSKTTPMFSKADARALLCRTNVRELVHYELQNVIDAHGSMECRIRRHAVYALQNLIAARDYPATERHCKSLVDELAHCTHEVCRA